MHPRYKRWTKRGAQMLLHERCALLNGELNKYSGWSPSDSSPIQPWRMTTQVLSSPVLIENNSGLQKRRHNEINSFHCQISVPPLMQG